MNWIAYISHAILKPWEKETRISKFPKILLQIQHDPREISGLRSSLFHVIYFRMKIGSGGVISTFSRLRQDGFSLLLIWIWSPWEEWNDWARQGRIINHSSANLLFIMSQEGLSVRNKLSHCVNTRNPHLSHPQTGDKCLLTLSPIKSFFAKKVRFSCRCQNSLHIPSFFCGIFALIFHSFWGKKCGFPGKSWRAFIPVYFFFSFRVVVLSCLIVVV